MPRMINRWEHPPGSWQFLQPELGQNAPFVGSFNYVCEQVGALRRANPFLCERHGLSTDPASIEAEVDYFNSMRCIAGGWTQFVILDSVGAPASGYTPPPEKKKRLLGVAAGRNVVAGVAVLIEWLGSGAKPVDASLSESRAAICVGCPRNDGGDFTSFFTQPIAEKIRTQLEIRNDLQLRTPYDDKLTVCSACSCPLKLKVHVDLAHILNHTSEEVKQQLDPRCWITSESKK